MIHETTLDELARRREVVERTVKGQGITLIYFVSGAFIRISDNARGPHRVQAYEP